MSSSGDISALKQFYQKRLALLWREYAEDYKLEITKSGCHKGEVWEDEAGVNARGQFRRRAFRAGRHFRAAADRHGGLALLRPCGMRSAFCGGRYRATHCQLDHLFAIARSWSATGSSRLVWNELLLIFEDVEALQARFGIHPSLVFLDAGHATYDVYRECADRGWVALMGDRRATFVHRTKSGKTVQRFYSARRKVVLGHTRHCFVHYWSNLNIKDTLARLRRNQDPERGATWEVPDDIDDEYLAQMESEQRVKDGGKWLWKQIGKRPNHYLDCEAMQAAAATMLKLIGRESVVAAEPASEGVAVDEADGA